MKTGLIGKVLGHSRSPEIHERIMSELQMGEPFHYDLLEMPEEAVGEKLKECQRNGYTGLNVTIPYKQTVMPFLTEISPAARMIGAVNTIHITPDGLFGYNTDYDGFGRSLIHAGIPVKNRRCTVLGTGGAARAVIQYIADQGAASITVVSRHPEKQGDFTSFLKQTGAALISYEALPEQAGDVLVNCTPVGMFPDTHCPVSEEIAASYEGVVDLIYNPKQTPLLQAAQKHQAKALNGMYMLVAQAAGAEEYWLGKKIEETVIERIAREME